MKINLNCPVEAWRVTLPTQEEPSCEVTLFNLSSIQVVSVEVTLKLSTADEEESAKIIHRGRSLAGLPGKTFRMTVPVEGRIQAERYEVTVEKVWFDNNSVWRNSREEMIEYTPNNLRRSAQLTNLRAVAGEMASGYPDQQEGLWVCVCGRPNLDETEQCARCHQQKQDVFARFSREAVDSVMQAREEELTQKGKAVLAQAGQSDKKDFVRRKKSKARFIKPAIVLLLLAGIGYGAVVYGVPYVRYELAKKTYAAGDYAGAEAAFAEIGDYQQAENYVLRSRFARAHGLLENAPTEADIMEARALLQTMPEYSIDRALLYGEDDANSERFSAAEDLRRCDEMQAAMMLSQGRLDEAEVIYTELNSEEELQEIQYRRACALLDEEKWGEARKAFEVLGEYKDSASLMQDTWYIPAAAALNSGDTETALSLLANIPGHKDADDLIRKVHYDAGMALREEGKIDEAAEKFYLAIGYQDAADQANECFYAPASVALEILDYERAAELFSKILSYRDAQEKWTLATYESAKKAIKEIKYDKAAALLSQLPQDYQDTASLLLDCTYLPAHNAYVRMDYAEAIEGFRKVPGHRDSEEMIRRCQYDWAGKLRESGQYEDAAALYTELNDYQDAATLLKAIRSEQADVLAAQTDVDALDQAIALYTGLGEYGNSASKLQDVQYRKADALMASGSFAEAKALYLSLGEYKDVADKALACDYSIASELDEAGKTEEAIAAFTALGDYADSADRVDQLRYDAAASLALTGDRQGAIEAFTALGEFGNSADRVLQLQYEAALELSVNGSDEAAIAAFEALGEYSDSADRADQIRYQQAEALIKSDWEAAAAAFDALGAFSDSADRANQLRYVHAESLIASDWEAAAAAFDALGEYSDSADRAGQLRYAQAEAMIESDWEAAAAAFDALGGYSDSADRAGKLRYEYAESLIESDWRAAAEAFEKTGGYADSADRAMQLRYDAAVAIADTGDWKAAAEALESLGNYNNSYEKANQLRYTAAASLAFSGDWEKALEIYDAMSDYADCADKALALRYDAVSILCSEHRYDEASQMLLTLGDYRDSKERLNEVKYLKAAHMGETSPLSAAQLFQSLGSYRDAPAQVEAMYDRYFGPAASDINQAYNTHQYEKAIELLRTLDLTKANEKYAYLRSVYKESCYLLANSLYDAGKPYEALAYYREIPGYKSVDDRLSRSCYLILGTWEDLKGNRYVFRDDGTCSMAGEELYFNIDGTSVFTGDTSVALARTHRLTSVTNKNAWLFDGRSGTEITVYLTRVSK